MLLILVRNRQCDFDVYYLKAFEKIRWISLIAYFTITSNYPCKSYKNQNYFYLLSTISNTTSFRSPAYEHLAPWHTEQGCNAGKSPETCVNFADSEIEFNLSR